MALEIPEFPALIDPQQAGFGEAFDELPLWSAPFGIMLLEHVPLKRGIKILDIGAGTGFLTIELARRCGDDSQVIAVDPWAAAMDRLRFKINMLGIENVTLLDGDIENVAIEKGSIDLAVSNLGVNNFAQASDALSCCRDALAPGGTLALTTNLVGHMQELYDEFALALEELGLED